MSGNQQNIDALAKIFTEIDEAMYRAERKSGTHGAAFWREFAQGAAQTGVLDPSVMTDDEVMKVVHRGVQWKDDELCTVMQGAFRDKLTAIARGDV